MGTNRKKVLIVDDETSVRHMLRLVLEGAGYVMSEAGSGTEALQFLQADSFDIVLSDIRMPELDGLGLLQKIKELGVDSMVIMMSAYGSVDTAVECLKHGAYDYISKPFKPDEVILTLRKAEERIRLQQENVRLRQQLSKKTDRYKIVYRSKVMDRLLTLVTRVAETNSPVLVTGETGTGKELIARALHQQSARAKKSFIAVNCGAIAPSLVESELFGHARGAFTGAVQQKAGLFEEASGGTLFLDEIGELPMDLQPKLLRVLQEGEVRRVGENKSRKVDVRVLAATARDLRELVANGEWRDDLFFRLAVVEMHVPPLRERREDILLLAKYFASAVAAREGRPTPEITQGVADTLNDYSWPGNVRELANFMEKTMIFCRSNVLDLETLPGEMRRRQRDTAQDYSLKEAALRLEKEYIRKALAATDGNRTQAAKLLEISLRKLLYKIKEYGIE